MVFKIRNLVQNKMWKKVEGGQNHMLQEERNFMRERENSKIIQVLILSLNWH
jgi:hypothetical protein